MVLSTLSDKPKTASQIARELGCYRGTPKKYLERLEVSGAAKQTETGWIKTGDVEPQRNITEEMVAKLHDIETYIRATAEQHVVQRVAKPSDADLSNLYKYKFHDYNSDMFSMQNAYIVATSHYLYFSTSEDVTHECAQSMRILLDRMEQDIIAGDEADFLETINEFKAQVKKAEKINALIYASYADYQNNMYNTFRIPTSED